jgi:hypothetical protein
MIPNQLIELFDHSSLTEIAGAIYLGMVVAALAGFLIRRVPGIIIKKEGEDEGQEAYVVSAVLGLLALLMGFTFSLALDRYEDRRDLVLQESNAIGTAFLRTQLLPEPSRGKNAEILYEYTQNRIELAGKQDDRFAELMARNDALLRQLWDETVSVVETLGSTPIASSYVTSVNEVIDVDASRKEARQARVPSAVYATLLVFIMLSAGILGYVLVGLWSRIAAVLLFLLFTLALLLIIDIDRPLVGSLRESQQPMIGLRDAMTAELSRASDD